MIDEKLMITLRNIGFDEQALKNTIVSAREEGLSYSRLGRNILVTFITYAAGDVRDAHTHPELRITFIRDGRAIMSIGERKREVASGDVIITLPNEHHALTVKGRETLNICELVIDASEGW